MDIGNQIRTLRLRRGITQEAMAQHFGLTPQAISKWERGTATPDIAILPELSAYFGVSIDALFALSDDLRMDRIQNMLWDTRYLDPTTTENERQFLLEKARREPQNPDPHCMLAQLEIHLAREHQTRAEEYAREIIARYPQEPYVGFMYLAQAMNGAHYDPRFNLRNELISVYQEHLAKHPGNVDAYQWLIGQLIADHRLKEARECCDALNACCDGFTPTVQYIKLALAERRMEDARALWEKMGEEYPDDFTVWQWIGDFQTQAEDYAAAKKSYHRSISLLKPPRYKDPIVAWLWSVKQMEITPVPSKHGSWSWKVPSMNGMMPPANPLTLSAGKLSGLKREKHNNRAGERQMPLPVHLSFSLPGAGIPPSHPIKEPGHSFFSKNSCFTGFISNNSKVSLLYLHRIRS